MNILELDNYSLDDAVKFHDRLNPRLWGSNEHLKPEVASKLLEIAADFQEFLGVADLDVVDITVSGSNAAFSYTPHSDIDLHLVIKMPEENRDIYQELFNSKKYQYNDEHNIKIRGADVELYAQPSDEQPKSQGIYSLKHNKWIQVPKRRKAEIDDSCVKSKVEDLDSRIHSAIESGDNSHMQNLWAKIKEMRKSGLETNGEFGCENLAFKILRTKGCLKELKSALNAARDQELSMAEQYSQPVIYGFREDVTSTPDGVSASTRMFLSEVGDDEKAKIVQDFIKDTAEWLGIENLPEIHIFSDPGWSAKEGTFGRYLPHEHKLEVNIANRHIMDTLRTVAHELAHCKQHEVDPMPDDAGDTGSPWENEAHAIAGIIMRHYADTNPGLFENASGYIPTAKEKNDPRYSMALTVDIKPGQVGKEANKLALKTNKQGKPALLMKTANMIGEALDKPEMTVSELAKKHRVSVNKIKQQLAKGIRVEKEHTTSDATAREIALDHLAEFPDYYDRLEKVETKEGIELSIAREFALFEDQDLFEVKMSPSNLKQEAAKTGAMAGMEFEMIVPNAEVDEEPNYEPDYDQDQRTRSFSDIRDFFYDGDYNSRRDVDRLEEELQDQFGEWLEEQIDEAWASDGLDYLRDYIENNDYFDEEEATEEATNALQAEYGDDITPEDFQKMLDALVKEKFDEFVQDQWDNQGRYYDDALDQFRDEQRQDIDESDWLHEHYPYMTDITNNFDIAWPYYYDTNEGNGDTDIETVADDFSRAVGMRVNWSSNYHGGRREPDAYVVEPDGSLSPDNSGDGGLEFVSPPMPIDKMINQLNKVKEWADNYGCYTNSSTGLHINISVPNFDLQKLDYVKLALLLGDKYVLDQFGRSSNTYTKSALGKVQDLVRKNPESAKALMDKMRGHMEDFATKAIHSGTTDKYTSINTKSGYIEFRSPGGDWLNANFDKIENTLMRFTVALSAAMNPEAYREEYLKKLYKLLEPVAEENKEKDTIKFFSDYVAGKMPKAALRSFIKQAQLERKTARGEGTPGQKYWWNVQWDSNRRMEVVAANKNDARAEAAKEWGVPVEQLAIAKVTMLRPYEETPAQPAGQNQGNWGIWITSANRFSRAPGQMDNSVLRRFPSREAAEQWIEQARSSNSTAMRTDIEVREIEPSQPIPGSTLDLQRRRAAAAEPQEWELFNMQTGQVVGQFRANGYREAEQHIQRTMSAAGQDPDQYDARPVNSTSAQQSTGQEPPIWYVSIIGRPGTEIQVRARNAGEAQGQAHTVRPDIFGDNEGNIRASTVPVSQAAAQQRTADQQQGGTVDVAGETPAATGEFTGNWRILDAQGREIHRFGGIGNSQSDANNFAIRWLQQNPRYMQAGVEVVPEMA